MARPKPWLKMWIEWIHDPKMLALTLAETGVWWKLVTLAQQCVADGQLVKGNGSPLSLPEIATSLHLKGKGDFSILKTMIEKMLAANSLSWSNKTLTIIHFKERQEQAASSTPEAIRERVRRHREHKAVTENSLPPLTTPTTKEGDIEAEVEVECNRYVTAENSLHRNGKPVTPEAVLAEISQLYEKNFGLITPLLAEKFKDFAENYQGPLGWIRDAFEEACSQNVRKWVYVEKILNTCQVEGRKPHGERKQPTREGPKRLGAHRGRDKEYSAEELRESLE